MSNPTARHVVHNEQEHRFELPIEDDAIATLGYDRDEAGRYVLTYTRVPNEYSGRGIASKLALDVFEIARTRGFRLILRCPYLTAWLGRHPEFAGLVDVA